VEVYPVAIDGERGAPVHDLSPLARRSDRPVQVRQAFWIEGAPVVKAEAPVGIGRIFT